jgi:hypothetical protein
MWACSVRGTLVAGALVASQIVKGCLHHSCDGDLVRPKIGDLFADALAAPRSIIDAHAPDHGKFLASDHGFSPGVGRVARLPV